jgi:uncharacterized protein YndB with AHSA1/START domain
MAGKVFFSVSMSQDGFIAITNPAGLADWLLPFDADITVDPRKGGEMLFAGRGEESVTMTCTILRIEPPMLFEHTHTHRCVVSALGARAR